MPREVKICGLSGEEGVEAALDAGADFVGFAFFGKSPRNVTPARAAALAEPARGKAGIVALTVNADNAMLGAICAALRPDLLQLHGGESPERVAEVRALTGRPVMKVLSVAARDDLVAAGRYDAAARFLIDAKAPKGATRPGGNAVPFDWSILDGFATDKPWFLAGGLTPDNVAAALARTGAPGVDVSSGVESVPGVKDPERIHAFVRAVREFDQTKAQQRFAV